MPSRNPRSKARRAKVRRAVLAWLGTTPGCWEAVDVWSSLELAGLSIDEVYQALRVLVDRGRVRWRFVRTSWLRHGFRQDNGGPVFWHAAHEDEADLARLGLDLRVRGGDGDHAR